LWRRVRSAVRPGGMATGFALIAVPLWGDVRRAVNRPHRVTGSAQHVGMRWQQLGQCHR
jgi:hypothetical protein